MRAGKVPREDIRLPAGGLLPQLSLRFAAESMFYSHYRIITLDVKTSIATTGCPWYPPIMSYRWNILSQSWNIFL